MSRLIAFGCSFTWGSALPDESGSELGDPIRESKFAWPAVLAALLSRTVVNQGLAGSSNKEIARKVLEFDYEPDDIVIVMWTIPLRSIIFRRKQERTDHRYHISSINDHKDKLFYSLHSEFDLEYTDMMYISSALSHLENQKILYINSAIGDFWTINPKWFESYRPKITFAPDYIVDYAMDQAHPGVRSHQRMARQFLTIVPNLGDARQT
jgi:hypothetical protein